MLIETLELEGVGPFRGRVSVGPFAPGLNVLAQHNEWGKSTVFKAMTRALFDKYSSQSEEIKALRPKGSSLSPQIEIVFTARGGRWQLRKRFLDGKASELLRWAGGAWERTDESDKADQHLRELLGAQKLEGRTVKPETWGLLRYLWARQDEPADWPAWDGASGDEARRRLATVELDHTLRALVARLDEQRAAIFTDSGRLKAKGPLELAEQEVARLESERARLQERHDQTESLQQNFARLSCEIAALEIERTRLREEAATLQKEAHAAERWQQAIGVHSVDLKQADEALQQVRRDLQTHERLALEAAALGEKMAEEKATARRVEEQLPGLETALAEAQRGGQSAQQSREIEERNLDRLRALLRWRTAMDEASALSVQKAKVEAAQRTLRDVEERRATLPTLAVKRLQSWCELERTMRESAAQIDALGLRVTLTPDKAATVEIDGHAQPFVAGEGEILKAPQAMTLRLDGWGQIEIRSGAREVGEIEATHRAAESRLGRELGEAGLATLAAAESAAQQAAELDQQSKPLRTTLADLLGEQADAAALSASTTRAQASAEEQHRIAHPDEADTARTANVLRNEEQALAAKAKVSARQADELAKEIENARAKLETAHRAWTASLAEQTTLAARRTGLLDQQGLLAGRYPGELAASLALAQSEFTRAEARLAEALRQLPANAEKLPARSTRAINAAADADGEAERKNRERRDHEVQLRERGGEGLYSLLATTDEKLELVRREVARIRTEGWALRLAAESIKRREQRAIQTVLGPLEERLSAVLAELTGEPSRRVFFDEHLAIRGVGRSEDELVPFDDLSRGTREQLLLALRAAIALEIAKDEPACLILDDVLVHTDAVRQQNVLDFLQTLSQRVQIVILTCHADRYRGVGQLLAVTR